MSRSARRLLSYSEISTALDCEAKWDFAYGGHLAGTSLKKKATAPILSAGRAWGAGVAALHLQTDPVEAMDAALEEDAERMRALGVHDQDQHNEIRVSLLKQLAHYRITADVFPVEPNPERKLEVAIPARSGKRLSPFYRLLAYVDAYEEDYDGVWLVEFKLRGQLVDAWMIQLSRQIRWYAWAWQQATGMRVKGVKVVERWNQAPKPPRLVKSRKKVDGGYPLVPSHAKDQLCTEEAYRLVCQEHDVEPDPETAMALALRRWQQVVPIMLRHSELEESGLELVSAAQKIRDLDNGHRYPLRNPKRANCAGCAFREICPSPDTELVDALFERVPPKRLREELHDDAA